MKADPACCVVIEDSVPGVTAAAAAGMSVAGFVGGGHRGQGHAGRLRSAGAALVIEAMPELLPALAALPSRLR